MSLTATRPRKADPTPSGFVYFVQAKVLRLIKIGCAVEPIDRLYTLRCGSPDELTLLGVIRAANAMQVERGFHHQFATARQHGEWFEPTPDLLATIKLKAVDYDELLSAENTANAMRVLAG